ncbi:hypothetical protein L580_2206 [Serratia fonticola AU-P3(3)]|nr:hypothetical protein L580_2206 [Serratia fonticola AU-P3(3)]
MRVIIAASTQSDDEHDGNRTQYRAGVLAFPVVSGWLLGALNRWV